VRTLIAESDAAFCRKLRSMLEAFPELEVCGETGSARRAVQLLQVEQPDVIFLDVQLEGKSGFDVAREAPEGTKIVFTAPSGDYALLAFRSNAVDYLVKPVVPGRLEQTVERLLEERPASEKPAGRRHGYDDPLFLSTARKSAFYKISQILFVRADGDYSEVRTVTNDSLLILRTMKEWESLLPENHFLRIHRSTIINSNFIEKVEKEGGGSFLIFLKDLPEPFTMSRRYSIRLKRRLR
jgi:two-component system LytT family response regulator